MKIERFEDVKSWQAARELTCAVYEVSNTGMFAKDHALKDQIRRASGSIMHNIAEGFDGGSHVEFARFLRYAQRSCSEVMSQLYVAIDQYYITNDQFNSLFKQAEAARSLIGGFIFYLNKTGTHNLPLQPTSGEGQIADPKH